MEEFAIKYLAEKFLGSVTVAAGERFWKSTHGVMYWGQQENR
jgi:hypothetical protein